jgi:hypothetical protein
MAQVIEEARARMELAKARFTAAARATLAHDPDAPRLSMEAIRELDEARAALKQAEGEQ